MLYMYLQDFEADGERGGQKLTHRGADVAEAYIIRTFQEKRLERERRGRDGGAQKVPNYVPLVYLRRANAVREGGIHTLRKNAKRRLFRLACSEGGGGGGVFLPCMVVVV